VARVQLERPEPRSGEDERAWRRQAAEDHRGARKIPSAIVLCGGRAGWSRCVA